MVSYDCRFGYGCRLAVQLTVPGSVGMVVFISIRAVLRKKFSGGKLHALDKAKFIGLQNYIQILNDPEFYRAVLHSLQIVVIAVPVQTLLGLLMAILVNQKIKGKGIFRTVFFIPYITSQIAITTVFMMLFKKKGPSLPNFSLCLASGM